jgi:SAM-dependent methyltransferase
MTLWSDFLNNDQRIIHKWKHYFPAYERHFGKFVNTDVTFLEIGCGGGGSLQMWKRFLGPYARIVGIDLRPECKEFAEDQIDIRIGDQSDKSFLLEVCKEFGTPNVVLDDGSHIMSHIHASFSALYPQLSQNSVYMVEDLHTAYWSDFEGGLKRKESFIETCKDLIDELNADHSRGALAATEFSRTTLSMHFYDSIVVFEKGRHGLKNAPQIGTPPRAPRRRLL